MGMGGFGTCQVLMVHGVATSLIPWASQRRLSWCHTSERLSWSTAAWRCWPGSAWWHLTLSAFLVRSFPLRLCQCPLMPTMLSLGLLVSMLKCCSGWALWSCAAPRRSLNGTPWRSLVTTASPVCSPVMRRVRRRCAQPSWRTAAWLWWHSQVQWPRLPSPAIRSHGCSEMLLSKVGHCHRAAISATACYSLNLFVLIGAHQLSKKSAHLFMFDPPLSPQAWSWFAKPWGECHAMPCISQIQQLLINLMSSFSVNLAL